jgi:hypothetical protein
MKPLLILPSRKSFIGPLSDDIVLKKSLEDGCGHHSSLH